MMTETQTLLGLLEQLWQNPKDQELRCICADADLDAGDDLLAECLHWMAKNDKYPYEKSRKKGFGSSTWWEPIGHDYSMEGKAPIHSVVPDSDYFVNKKMTWNWQDSIQESEEMFYSAWKEARGKGWIPSDDA